MVRREIEQRRRAHADTDDVDRALEEPAEEPISSWLWLGPALVVGFVPSVVLSFADPGAVRPTAALVAGAAVLVLGAILRWRAAVDVGVPVVVVVGLRQLVPVAGDPIPDLRPWESRVYRRLVPARGEA